MRQPRKCRVCGKEFIPRSSTQKYCSRKCNRAAQNSKYYIYKGYPIELDDYTESPPEECREFMEKLRRAFHMEKEDTL